MTYLETLSTSPSVEPFTFAIDGVDDHMFHGQATTPLSPAPGDHSANTSAPSFESILSGKSIAPFSRVAFADFLRKIHCSENLEFLISADNFLTTTDNLTRKHLWHYIYTNFISTYALKEVNIPHELRSQLNGVFEADEVPCENLMVHSMMVIKELLRDAYFQFVQQVKRQQTDQYFDHFSLLSFPTEEDVADGGRRMSGHCPLETPLPSTRCVSPLFVGESAAELVDVRNKIIPRSEAVLEDSSDEYRDKKYSLTSNKSVSTKNSSFSESYGLKKLAGKFRWRRMSSNSSASSS